MGGGAASCTNSQGGQGVHLFICTEQQVKCKDGNSLSEQRRKVEETLAAQRPAEMESSQKRDRNTGAVHEAPVI